MNWVTIDKERCNGCGLCAIRCMRCFTNKDGEITVNANAETCNICGHCIALCPADAITHSQMNMNNFPDVNDQIHFDTDEFIQFIRQRRSHRSFKDKPIPKENMAKLIEMCRYIPTGSNLQTVEIKVITQPEKIKKLSDLTVDYFQGMIKDVETQMEAHTSKGEEIPPALNQWKALADRYKMLPLARDFGMDPILHKAPAVMVFHSAPSPSTPKDDCVIAAQTVVLGAMTMGLGTCYIGLLNFSANGSPRVKEALNLPPGNKPYCILILGYPKLKFRRAVDRTPVKVQWDN